MYYKGWGILEYTIGVEQRVTLFTDTAGLAFRVSDLLMSPGPLHIVSSVWVELGVVVEEVTSLPRIMLDLRF